MKLIIVILGLYFLIPSGFSNAQENVPQKGRIVLEIINAENNSGTMFAHLFNNKDYFPKLSDKAFKFDRVKISKNKAVIVFEDVPFGDYAITTHHDQNNNGIMDKSFLGYPSEGFGLSNNPKIFMSVPSYDECKFTLKQNELKITIITKYM